MDSRFSSGAAAFFRPAEHLQGIPPRDDLLDVLPNELLCHIFSFLPLKDLSICRVVCLRFQDVIDGDGYRHLWARAPLVDSCEWVAENNKAIIQRAADCGNVEALIMLAVAHIYCEGAAEGVDKGTTNYSNGVTAARLLLEAEKLKGDCQPFSWVLFRPPWSPNCTCCKACIWHQLRRHSNETDGIPQVYYLLGKALVYLGESWSHSSLTTAEKEFKSGSTLSCSYATFELWKMNYRNKIYMNEFDALRQLRRLTLAVPSFWEPQLELCLAYSEGYFGGVSKIKAISHIRHVLQSSAALISRSTSQHALTRSVRYILIDWMVEVAEMKEFSTTTVHVAVSLIDRYLHLRHVKRSHLQLLGIAALLLSSRWTSDFILTVRESSWLTEKTYRYDEVVRMTGKLLAVLQGEIAFWRATPSVATPSFCGDSDPTSVEDARPVIPDYLSIFLKIAQADIRTQHMAHYLSESLLHHAVFGPCTCAELAAACFVLARILLGHGCPWPHFLAEYTGYAITDLQRTCLEVYNYCLTDTHSVVDNRAVRLQGVVQRYEAEELDSVSKHPILPFNVVEGQLAILCRSFQRSCTLIPITSEFDMEPQCAASECVRQVERKAHCEKLSFTLTVQSCSSRAPDSMPRESNHGGVTSLPRSPLRTVDANVGHYVVHKLDFKDVNHMHLGNSSSK